MEKLIIDRSKWVCGYNYNRFTNPSLMLNDNGLMCCLGCYAHAKRIPKKDLRYKYYPRGAVECTPKHTTKLSKLINKLAYDCLENSRFAKEAAEINDDDCLTQGTREQQLIKLFAVNDIELSFIGTLRKMEEFDCQQK